jgi:hypothetical protein
MSGQNPNDFGPPTWMSGHLISFAFENLENLQPVLKTDVYKRAVISFFNIITLLLECGKCREDGTHFNDHSLDMDVKTAVNQGKLFRRFVLLHNLVNQKLDKKINMSEAEAELFWRSKWERIGEQQRIEIFFEYVMRIMIHYQSYQSKDKNFFYSSFLACLPFLIAILTNSPITLNASTRLADMKRKRLNPETFNSVELVFYTKEIFSILVDSSIRVPTVRSVLVKVIREFMRDKKMDDAKAFTNLYRMVFN